MLFRITGFIFILIINILHEVNIPINLAIFVFYLMSSAYLNKNILKKRILNESLPLAKISPAHDGSLSNFTLI